MNGYLISKLGRAEIEQKLSHIRLRYDETLSKGLNVSVFWFDGVIDIEKQKEIKGRAFSLEDVINRGIQACATHIDFEDYLDKKEEKPDWLF